MSGKGVAFRIDVILQSVNELRQEKQALEQRYAEEKLRSEKLETKLEQERMKFCQSRDRNSKMQDTVKLAQQKVAQTESQADRLNEINDAKQKTIAGLNEKIKEETDKQESDVTEFQITLSKLTQLFRDAKKAYAKDNLVEETKTWKENMETLVNEANTKDAELEDVTKAFENLSVDTNKIKELVDENMGDEELTYEELKAASDHLTRKQEQLDKFLQWLEIALKKADTMFEEHNERINITAGQENEQRMLETEMTDIPPSNTRQEDAFQFVEQSSQDESPSSDEDEVDIQASFQQHDSDPDDDLEDQNISTTQNTLVAEVHQDIGPPVTTQQKIPSLQHPFFISLPFGRCR